ncbi:hypothetical protein [Pantoea sp. 18069]|uniref:hypothetical protein n=1 Tax=Pantoea sp. 18069 TaxID=2681415 RepID=UPI00135CB181|nr:hypothetical protein [Pantoea sp. 18069]
MPTFHDTAETPCAQGESPFHAPPLASPVDRFHLPGFLNGTLALNPANPFYAQICALDAPALQRYYRLGIPERPGEQGNIAEILTLGEPEFERIASIRAYIAHETGRGFDGEAGENDSLPWPALHLPGWPGETTVHTTEGVHPPPAMDAMLEQQAFASARIIIHTPTYPAQPSPPSYVRWLGHPEESAASFADGNDLALVLCGTNADHMPPPWWALG